MFSIYRWLYNLVGFSRTQSNGFIILLPLLMIFLFSEPIYRALTPGKRDFQNERKMLDSLIALFPVSTKTDSVVGERRKTLAVVYFMFDPNKIGRDEFLKLGFKPLIANRILKFREKGGAFRIKRDLLKINGLDVRFYHDLEPFIALPEEKLAIVKNKAANVERFDINLADTAQLKRINGIGEKLSLRIIKYREALGGFHALGQLYEVYKLDSLVVERLIARSYIDPQFLPAKKNINSTEKNALAIHPYISTAAASAIVTYRLKHGKFVAIEELRKLTQFDSVMFEKVKPYIGISDE